MPTKDELAIKAKLYDEVTRPLGDIRKAQADFRKELESTDKVTVEHTKNWRALQAEAKRAQVAQQAAAKAYADTTGKVDKVASKLTTTVTPAVSLLLGFSAKAASDLNETVSKSNTIFDKQGQAMLAWARNAATTMGLSQKAALDAAGTFGNMFTQLGLGGAQAADMSKKMVQLAVDFGSFQNVDSQQVIDGMTGAFRGEYDALQKFVPTISAATVEQQALLETHKKTAKELTASEKAHAAFTLIVNGAGAAAGDFSRTSDGMANKLRIAKAEAENAAAALGQELIPIIKNLTDAGMHLLGWFNDMPGPMKQIVTYGLLIAAGAGPILKLAVAYRQLAAAKAIAAAAGGGSAAAGAADAFGGLGLAGAAGLYVGLPFAAAVVAPSIIGGFSDRDKAKNDQKRAADYLKGVNANDLAAVNSALANRQMEAIGLQAQIAAFQLKIKNAHGTAVGPGQPIDTNDLSKLQHQLKSVDTEIDSLSKAKEPLDAAAQATFDAKKAMDGLGNSAVFAGSEIDDLKAAADGLADSMQRANDLFAKVSGASLDPAIARLTFEKDQADLYKLLGDPNATKLDRLQGLQGVYGAAGTLADSMIAAGQLAPEMKQQFVDRLLDPMAGKLGDINDEMAKLLFLGSKVVDLELTGLTNFLGVNVPDSLAGQLAAAGHGDTPTPHGFRGNLQRTLGMFGAAASMTPGAYRITNVGYSKNKYSDHKTGRALDVQGSNLALLARSYAAIGGWSEMHGTGSGRHLHMVAGDTPTSRAGMGGGLGGDTHIHNEMTIVQQPGESGTALAWRIAREIKENSRQRMVRQ